MKEHLETLIVEFDGIKREVDTIYQRVRMMYTQLDNVDAGDYMLVLDAVEQWRNECKYRTVELIAILKEVSRFWKS